MSAEFEELTLEDILRECDPDYFQEIEEEKSLGIPVKGIDKRVEREEEN